MSIDLLTLDLALIRWSVVCGSWGDIASGNTPVLQAFLAGWCCRAIGATEPYDVGQLRESFRAGWREADVQISIAHDQRQRVIHH